MNWSVYWLGRSDGLTCHSNLPVAGTVSVVLIAFGNARTSAGWPVVQTVLELSSV